MEEKTWQLASRLQAGYFNTDLDSMGFLSKFHVQSCALTIILEYFIFVFFAGRIIPPKNERPTKSKYGSRSHVIGFGKYALVLCHEV
jgi:hypothetical protein